LPTEENNVIRQRFAFKARFLFKHLNANYSFLYALKLYM